MTTITITVPSIYNSVKLTLQGVPEGVTPYSVIDGTEASPEYYIIPMAPFGNGILTSNVLGNDEISINGYTGTYYTVEIIDVTSQATLYQNDFEIVGETSNLDVIAPISGVPAPAIYATQDYVNSQIGAYDLSSNLIELEDNT